MKNRRQFVASAIALGATAALNPLRGQDAAALAPLPPIPKRPAALDLELVKEFVAAAHKDLDQTRTLLNAQRGLINATWDWGGGDFETALGGAAHMGQREIALFLLGNGARLDLFAAAMLGQTAIVRAVLETDPSLRNTPGPHGIRLIAHAETGGEHAAETLAYLESLE